MQTGLYYDLDFKEYRAMTDAVSISELNVYERAPLCYKHEILDGNKRKATPQQKLGTGLHASYLEEAYYDRCYHIGEKLDRRTKEGKILSDEREKNERENGFIYLEPEEFNKITNACEVLNSHPFLQTVKSKFKCEASMFWETNGVKCKGRLDAFVPENGMGIWDVKTTKDAKNFGKSIIDYGYHRQAAFYLDGLKATTGIDAKDFFWITIEMDAPHLCAIYQADEAMIEIGRMEYQSTLLAFKESKSKNEWAGLSNLVQKISLPTWYVKRASEVTI